MINDTTQLPPTLAATEVSRPTGPAIVPSASAVRTTVLPRVTEQGCNVQLTAESRSRYEPTKLLGVGGMGEVVLVRDHDIGRQVAVKRMLRDMTDDATLVRFVDEIRTVGRLEHPNIVPIHDVGLDELGRYYFVMKYVDGETLESIIEKLRAGDPAYLVKYSVEVRIELFVGLLHALEYAHANGIVHRDVKPANVMVGRYGEVLLMDWGIAKPVAAERDPAAGADGELAGEGDRARMYTTRVGSLIGTPAYMSPEQARGDNASVDARSDIYSAVVLLHELIGLHHYLEDKRDVASVIAAVVAEEVTFFKLLGLKYPHSIPRSELVHLFVKGLAKDPSRRFESAAELIEALHTMLEGKVRVQCPMTLTKRTFRELGRLTDRHPVVAVFSLVGIVAALIFASVQLVAAALHHV